MLAGSQPRRVAIVGGARIPFARGNTAYARVGNQEMLTAALSAVVRKYSLVGQTLGDVAAGAVMKHSSQWNLTRECVLSSGLSPQTPGVDLQRACGTSLEAAILIGNKIALGQIDSGIAAGVDTVSDPPVVFPKSFQELLLRAYRARTASERISTWLGVRPKHFKPVLPGVTEPRTGLSMGQSTEIMAKKWGITREEQDQLALESHQKATAAYKAGFYDDLLVEYQGLKQDNNVRADTSLDKLAKLKPAFDSSSGTLTAGNSTPMTDGAAAVLLASEEWARARNLPVLAYLSYAKVAAVDFYDKSEGLLMAPAFAVPAMLADANLKLQDFDFYEIHEAFAAQVLCTLKAWNDPAFCRDKLGLSAPLGGIDRSRLNVKGGSLALGHPFGATGARIVATLAKILDQEKGKRGLISICTAGGMGVTAILET